MSEYFRTTRREFLRRSAGLAVAGSFPGWLTGCREAPDQAGGRAPTSGPNLIYIMADDLGYADTSLYGRTDYQTPVLDTLAREGVRLTQAYSAAPVCSPTRVALMTGRYPARTEAGLQEPLTTHPFGLSPEPRTLSALLRDAGYETALVGKWHLGRGDDYSPASHGFDEFFGFRGAADDYVSHQGTETREHDLWDGNERVQRDGYLTDLLSDRAVEIIRRPRDRALFLSLQYNAPHWPWQAPGDPAWPDTLSWRAGGSVETYARMVRSMDEGIGRVLEAVRAAGLENDTLVIFTSDNGGERYSFMGPFHHGEMGTMSRSKFTLWEGGIRVAAFARWPGVIPAGSVSEQVVSTFDWTATLAAAAGAAADPVAPFDGVDVLPQLRGEPVLDRELFWRTFQRTRQKALRSGDWKYLVTEEGGGLYDLAADPDEDTNLSAADPERFASMEARYAEWEAGMLEPVPLDSRYA